MDTTPAARPQDVPAAVVVVLTDDDAATRSLAALPQDTRERLGAALHRASRLGLDARMAAVARAVLAEDTPDDTPVGVLFTTRPHSDGHYLHHEADVLLDTGEVVEGVDFGPDMEDLLGLYCGPRTADFGLALDLRTDALTEGDSLGGDELREVFARPAPADPDLPASADPRAELAATLTAVRHAHVAARMAIVADLVRRSWPAAASLSLAYVLEGEVEPVIAGARVTGVNGPDGPLWDREGHVWSRETPEVIGAQELYRIDAHLSAALPDARSLGRELRWTDLGDTATAPLPAPLPAP